MRLFTILLVSVVGACVVYADVAHLKAEKAKLLGKLAGRGKQHKRGVLGAVPTFKLGYDIPVVSHSVVKPFVVRYPPTAVPVGVKIPVSSPVAHRYPVPVGHRVPVPHPHYGLKFPHFPKFVVPKPDHHFHHHHHHVDPKPILPAPVLPAPAVHATPIIPIAQPTAPIAHPVPAPPQALIPTSVVPAPQLPVAPQIPIASFAPSLPPVHFAQQDHVHLNPTLPAGVAVQPSGPAIPLAPQFPYVIRPGNAIQASYYATYPRYPLVNYPTSLIPVNPAPVHQVYLDGPEAPHYHVTQQVQPAVPHHLSPSVTVHTAPDTLLQPTHPTLLQPTYPPVAVPQTPIDHDGWLPVPHQHQFTQEQATQIYEHHTDEQNYHDFHDHVQHQIHQLEQEQYEHNLNNHQLHEYGTPQATEYNAPHINQEYGQPVQEYAQPAQEYGAPQLNQEYGAPEHQIQQDYGVPEHHLNQEYGVPQQSLEGRSYPEEEDSSQPQQEQAYHNHIPLGLQPPIDRPLEHFR